MASATLPVQTIGGSGGSPYSRAFDGQRLTGIQAWAENSNNQKIRGLRLWFSDGVQQTERTFGTVTGTDSSRFNLSLTETIDSIQLENNGTKEPNGNRLGRIEIILTNGRSFKFGIKKTQTTPGVIRPPVGSGICVGYTVRSNLDIDAFGLQFLQPILSSEIVDVKFPTLGTYVVPITNLDRRAYGNDTTGPLPWNFGSSEIRTISSTWSVGATAVVGASVTVTAGVPFIAKVEGTFGWELSASYHQEKNVSQERTVWWEVSGTVSPNGQVLAIAVAGDGTINLNYTGTMNITTINGGKISYAISGQYKGVDISEVTITVSGDNIGSPNIQTGSNTTPIFGKLSDPTDAPLETFKEEAPITE